LILALSSHKIYDCAISQILSIERTAINESGDEFSGSNDERLNTLALMEISFLLSLSLDLQRLLLLTYLRRQEYRLRRYL